VLVYAMAFLLRYDELQAEQQTQSGKREQLLASLAVLRDGSQQGSSPGAVARKAAAHQASAQAVLHKVAYAVSLMVIGCALQLVLHAIFLMMLPDIQFMQLAVIQFM
jgi:uncharacterized membrane protein